MINLEDLKVGDYVSWKDIMFNELLFGIVTLIDIKANHIFARQFQATPCNDLENRLVGTVVDQSDIYEVHPIVTMQGKRGIFLEVE